MHAPDLIWLAMRVVVLIAGLLGPGAMLMRALGLPRTPATCFTGSTIALYAVVLGFALAGVTISAASLVAGLTVVTLGAGWFGRGAASTDLASAATPWHAPLTKMGPWTPLYLAFVAIALLRLWANPLAGADVEFRWSYLAEQMLRLGSLDFYPPHSAADFINYFWAESIPPGVSALHAWAYACAGSTNMAWAAPAIALQFWSLHELLWQIADRAAGMRAARFACLSAAACPLLTWAVLLGQETGLTTLALVGLTWSFWHWTHTHAPAWAAAAGLFATLGAAAREYGLVFPLLAIAGLLLTRADRRAWVAFAAMAAPGVIWPLRCAWRTGNPFYSLAVAGLPTNPRFVAWIEADAGTLGTPLRTVEGWREIGRYLALYAAPALLGWAALAAALRRQPRVAGGLLAASAVVLMLWIASVRYTNGGLFYSLRVASPALALGALATGIMLAAPTGRGARAGIATAVAALGLGMIAPSLALPQNPWHTSWRTWPAVSTTIDWSHPDGTLELLRREGPPQIVIADAPGFQRRFAAAGIRVVPPWSPDADWLFDPALSADEAARRWEASRVRYIVLTKWKTNLDFFNQHSRWGLPPFVVRPVGETSHTAIFSISATPPSPR